MSEIAFLPAVTLAAKIRSKEIGCMELLDHNLARGERLNGPIYANVVLDAERARARAREADAALARGGTWGPLHGVPMTIKESFDIAGLPSTWGLPELKNHRAAEDALSVKRLKAAGVTLFGKTNVPLLLADWQSFNAIYGTTNNPWDLTRTPGGSSGGSAAALAAGLTALEAGSDIGSSIRNPAHYCGVFGHKPTYGVLSPRGQALNDAVTPTDISVIGPLARSADDLEIALDAMLGDDALNSTAWQAVLPPARRERLKDFTVGVMLTDPNCSQDDALTSQLQATIDRLAMAGVKVSKALPAIDTTEQHRVYITLLRAATGGRLTDEVLAQHRARAAKADPADFSYKTMVDRAVTMSHKDWMMLNEARNRLRLRWADYFREVDLLLCPVAASAAFPHDQAGDRADRTIPINNTRQPTVDQLFWAGISGVVYLPGTAAPVGLTRDGLPVGLQIVGAHGEDRTTIHFARLMEREFGGFQAPPGYA